MVAAFNKSSEPDLFSPSSGRERTASLLAVIEQISKLTPDGYVAGVDRSQEMVQQALARNATAARSGRVDLRYGSVEKLPFDDNRFDKTVTVSPAPFAAI
jgi:SAM-dependent methyltransferase